MFTQTPGSTMGASSGLVLDADYKPETSADARGLAETPQSAVQSGGTANFARASFVSNGEQKPQTIFIKCPGITSESDAAAGICELQYVSILGFGPPVMKDVKMTVLNVVPGFPIRGLAMVRFTIESAQKVPFRVMVVYSTSMVISSE